jgi:CBS domain-containing protein
MHAHPVMLVRDIMSKDPVCCRADTPIPDVARLMVAQDCGSIPVLDEQRKPIGIVSDRDIVCRVVAAVGDTRSATAGAAMSRPCVTVSADTTERQCAQILEANQIRRVVVVDGDGRCIGIVAQADLARADEQLAGEVVAWVSRRRFLTRQRPVG